MELAREAGAVRPLLAHRVGAAGDVLRPDGGTGEESLPGARGKNSDWWKIKSWKTTTEPVDTFVNDRSAKVIIRSFGKRLFLYSLQYCN